MLLCKLREPATQLLLRLSIGSHKDQDSQRKKNNRNACHQNQIRVVCDLQCNIRSDVRCQRFPLESPRKRHHHDPPPSLPEHHPILLSLYNITRMRTSDDERGTMVFPTLSRKNLVSGIELIHPPSGFTPGFCMNAIIIVLGHILYKTHHGR